MSTIAIPEQVSVPAEVAHRLGRYIDAAKIAGVPDFPGLVLMGLAFTVPDEVWEDAIQSALRTICDVDAEREGMEQAARLGAPSGAAAGADQSRCRSTHQSGVERSDK